MRIAELASRQLWVLSVLTVVALVVALSTRASSMSVPGPSIDVSPRVAHPAQLALRLQLTFTLEEFSWLRGHECTYIAVGAGEAGPASNAPGL